MLYRLIAERRATFEQVGAAHGSLPRFVTDAFERFLRCGVPPHGFARFRCPDCRHEHLVPLSCKTRGLCPSCDGRRMGELTRHLLTRVLPVAPVRQWVLTLPPPLRYRLAYDHELCTAVHRIPARAVQSYLKRSARRRGDKQVRTGSVTFVQRYGGGLNLNVHFHQIALDGWFRQAATGSLAFVHAPTPPQDAVEAVLLRMYRRVLRLLNARGLLDESMHDRTSDVSPMLAVCYEDAVTQRMALGPRRGRPVLRLRDSFLETLSSASERVEASSKLCAYLDGFDLHARVTVSAHARHRLEELVRYCARPALANDRLSKQPDGHYLLRLRTPYRDGTTHLVFEPIELMERLAAQIPKPRVNLILYAGALAPNAKLRKQVVGYGRTLEKEEPRAAQAEHQPSRADRSTWAELMRCTFGLDMLACLKCGGRLQLIATILDGRVVRRILEHLKRPSLPPDTAPARDPPPFWGNVSMYGD